MNQPFDLSQVMLLWKQQYGTLKRSKRWDAEYYQIPIHERFELLKILIRQIKKAGKSEEYFSKTKRDEMVNNCVPHEKSVTPESLKMFKKGTLDHLNMAILLIYSEESEKIEENPKKYKEKPFQKEFDPTSIKINEPPVVHQRDPELAKLLGFEDDE